MTKKLLIISSDYISAWVHKGEVVPRYYNPNNIFDEVHIILTNDDKPDPRLVQPMLGNAKLYIYNFPEPASFFKKTLGWQPFLMRKWAKGSIDLAKKIKPDLIRCYGLSLSTFVGVYIKEKLGIPCMTSLHGNPDVDYLRGRLAKTWKDRLIGLFQENLEKHCLKRMDCIVGVYSPIEPYLIKHRVKNYYIIHNVVGIGAKEKTDYMISDQIKLLCVGRQSYLQKDPSSIIKAVSEIENASLTLVGDGDLHETLKKLACSLGCENRITFINNMINEDILCLMRNSDIYTYHSINYEISKTCIEAALVGLPIILNNRNNQPAQEIIDAGFYLVDDTPESYKEAILNFSSNMIERRKLAKNSHMYAKENWGPDITEKKLANVYRNYLNS